MSKNKIFNLLERLGMIDEENVKVPSSKDVISIINFVDDLMTYNDEHTIKKFLICLFTMKE